MPQSAAAFAKLPEAQSHKPDLRIVIVGHVDHGKSTLVGRLLHETGALPDGKFEQIKASCDRRNMPFEWAFCMDALQAERDQNVTIDTTQIWFSSPLRRYCLIDAPGHREFLKNMITGAASADAALLMIDAAEGMKEQSRRHAHLLSLLGIAQVVVVVNKMDLVSYAQSRFDEVKAECEAYLRGLGIAPLAYVPVSAREGENLAKSSAHMKWAGAQTILSVLDTLSSPQPQAAAPLRLWVQDVYRFDHRRVIAGRIESGSIKVGDKVMFLPSGAVTEVKSFEQWPEGVPAKTHAQAGESVAITLTDPLFVERGQLACHETQPAHVVNQLTTQLFWLHAAPLTIGKTLRLKLGAAEVKAQPVAIRSVTDTENLTSSQAEEVARHQVAEVVWRLRSPLPVDSAADLPACGRVVLFDGYDVAGGGIVMKRHDGDLVDMRAQLSKKVKSTHITSVDFEISADERANANGHKGGVIWLTGLSGSGKSTLAKELQTRLFERGCQVYVLDGDNIRSGLCSDLGFSADDRSENIRRIGEVAALFADAGMIVITAFISPYRSDRLRARSIAPQHFHTVYVKASVEACEGRDVKGLYKKARAGEISDFTGISSPYEPPEFPDLVVDTESASVIECTEQLVEYIKKNLFCNTRSV